MTDCLITFLVTLFCLALECKSDHLRSVGERIIVYIGIQLKLIYAFLPITVIVMYLNSDKIR